MNKARWLALWVVMVLPLTAQAQVYKWKDNNGVTLYSDSPPPGNVSYEVVDSLKAAPSATTSGPVNVDSQAARNAAALRRQTEAEQERRNEEKQRSEKEAKRLNCENARANYQNFKIGGRIYKMTPEGEREYMGDEDIQRGLQEATKEVQQYCTEE